MDLSIIIVSYNTRVLTLECLQSIFEQTSNVEFEVIVIDNNSNDESTNAIAERFQQVRLIASKENHGFARANNLASHHARGEYLLLLNPDTVVLDHAIEKLLSFAKTYPDAGIYGGRTIFSDGNLNPTCCFGKMTIWSLFCRAFGFSKMFKNTTLFNPESYGSWKRDSIKQVDIITGCFFLLKRDLWNQLNGFNPVFFMFGEEVDFCIRASELGCKPFFTPDATIVHYGGASENKMVNRLEKILCAESTIIREHWHGYKSWWALIMLLIWVRMKSAVFVILSRFNPTKFGSQSDAWNELWVRRNKWLKGWTAVRNP